MADLRDIFADRQEVLDKMTRRLEACEKKKRDMTEDERKEYETWDKEVDRFNVLIRGYQKVDNYAIGKDVVVNPINQFLVGNGSGHQESRDTGGFENLAELLYTIKETRTGRADERLIALREEQEKREQTMGTGSQGGFALPTAFWDTMLQAPTQGGIVRSKATVIPPGDVPDGQLLVPSLDQRAAENNYGGVVITHGGEGVTLAETDIALRQITLEAKQMNAYIVISNKLLRNWSMAGQFVTMQLTKAVGAQEDYDFLRGDGVNRAIGIINSPAAIAHSRAGANAVAFADVYGMLAKVKMGGSLCWLASQTIIPQLAAMVDAGSHAVWLGSTGDNLKGAAAGMPSTLMGWPLYFVDRLPKLGTKGDLILADLSYYYIKDGSWSLDLSTELLFLTDRSVFRVIHNVDGKTALSEPLRLEGDSTESVSPFVVLE